MSSIPQENVTVNLLNLPNTLQLGSTCLWHWTTPPPLAHYSYTEPWGLSHCLRMRSLETPHKRVTFFHWPSLRWQVSSAFSIIGMASCPRPHEQCSSEDGLLLRPQTHSNRWTQMFNSGMGIQSCCTYLGILRCSSAKAGCILRDGVGWTRTTRLRRHYCKWTFCHWVQSYHSSCRTEHFIPQ